MPRDELATLRSRAAIELAERGIDVLVATEDKLVE